MAQRLLGGGLPPVGVQPQPRQGKCPGEGGGTSCGRHPGGRRLPCGARHQYGGGRCGLARGLARRKRRTSGSAAGRAADRIEYAHGPMGRGAGQTCRRTQERISRRAGDRNEAACGLGSTFVSGRRLCRGPGTGAPGGGIFKRIAARATSGDYTPDFRLRWTAKDLGYASAEAAQSGLALETAASALSVFNRAIEPGHGEEDFSAVIKSAKAISL
jgi:hypothetical protein